jgi:hypothetical protein
MNAPTDAAFISKLASSGLDVNDAIKLGITFVPNCAVLGPSFQALKGMTLPYFDINGAQTEFFRARYLELPSGFGAQIAKPQRYAQKVGSLNEVYLPPFVDWQVLANRPTEEILITEGELKAACAAKHGYNCMALGGVSTWSSAKRNIPLLEPLPQLDWHGRSVIIVFDSDASTNPNVARAQVALAKMLLSMGALPKVATLPPALNGDKQGLDDFLIAGNSLQPILAEVRSLELGDRLSEMNSKFAYVMDQDVVIELETAHRIKRDSFVNGLLANHSVIEYQPSANGTLKRTEVKVAAEWLKWSARLDVQKVTYEPGKAQITDKNEYNTWPGWGCEPRPGDVAPWTSMLGFLFGNDTESIKLFEQWCAYPLQYPGTKLFTSVVLWGPETGTGKSLIGYTLGSIYGQNFTEIGNTELHASFNEWAINKQFILGDEISGTDKRQEADKLKALITQQSLRINMKNLPTYTVPDCINFYFTSNHPDAFFLADSDRRFFILRTKPDARREPEYYAKYMQWLGNGGSEALFDYLMRIDVSDFNPKAPAPITESKLELVDHGRSDLSGWVAYFMDNMELELARLAEYLQVKPNALDVVLNTHLKWLYDGGGTTRVTPNGLGRELSRFGLKTVGPVPCAAYGKRRFYVLRNANKWLNVPPIELTKYLDSNFKATLPAATKF